MPSENPREIVSAHSPDSDDAFMFYGLATKKVRSPKVTFRHVLQDIETLMPLPLGKTLNITLWLEDQRVDTAAVIRSCDGGVGMGIEFTGLDEETQQRLQKQIETMAADSAGLENAPGVG